MISIIVAIASNRTIGADNKLLWHISEDLQHFKSITTGHPVIMGRKTFESLGRPLPRRQNVVITRNASYAPEGVTVVHSLEEALALFPADDEVFVIGGGEIYREAMHLADKIYLTVVEKDYEGDTHFPEIDPSEWRQISREYNACGKDFPHPFVYEDYERVRK